MVAARKRINSIVSVPAPVGGWNARDSFAEMGPTDAVTLLNYFPRTTAVELRFGYTRWATGITGQVETLINYSGGSTNKFFAVNAAGSIFNITTTGAVGSADVTGLNSGRFQYVNVATTGGNYIMAVSGLDKAQFYTGSAWAKDGDGSPYNITGVDSTNCLGITLFKNRVWLIQKNTLKAWYLPTGAIGGAATLLDLSTFCPHGGGLTFVGTWTIDGGYGMDDYLVFGTSNGDVLVYGGTDPASASTFALRGVWWIGSPIGNRAITKWAGDLLIISQDGVYALSSALQSSRVNPKVALSNKIQQAVSDAVTSYGTIFGWQVIPFPQENMLMVNVPVQVGAQEQYVMNSITGAWGQFQGYNANCFELFGDLLYFGANGFVGRAWNTNTDNGAAINGFINQAFGHLGASGYRKRAVSMRPLFLTNGSPSLLGGINWDYNMAQPTSALSTSSSTFANWDSGVWGSGIWGGGLNASYAIQGVAGSGWTGAPVFKSNTQGMQLQLVSTDVAVELGGFL